MKYDKILLRVNSIRAFDCVIESLERTIPRMPVTITREQYRFLLVNRFGIVVISQSGWPVNADFKNEAPKKPNVTASPEDQEWKNYYKGGTVYPLSETCRFHHWMRIIGYFWIRKREKSPESKKVRR